MCSPVARFTWMFHLVCVYCSLKTGQAVQCVQCLSEEHSSCVDHPPPPLPCNGTDFKFCIVLEERTTSGEILRLTRSCGSDGIQDGACEEGIGEGGISILVCHRACTINGCNGTSEFCVPPSRFILTVLTAVLLYINSKHC